jgi:pimeloyl-ACP methyl ester carboxylesterase
MECSLATEGDGSGHEYAFAPILSFHPSALAPLEARSFAFDRAAVLGTGKTILFWGQDDIFFTRAGAEAYLKDLPKAEMHRLDSGHFALEDHLDYISSNMRRFYSEKVASGNAP